VKGIILAGGKGSRLFPMTISLSKQLLPIYDKPMIYYPLSTLMSAGIKDILIITTPNDLSAYSNLLRDGSHFGISIKYEVQPYPRGIAESFIIGKDFIGDDSVTLILGDNIFHSQVLNQELLKIKDQTTHDKHSGAHIFGYAVPDPERYGVLEFTEDDMVLSIEEKPVSPKSKYAVVGVYVYDKNVVNLAYTLNPSKRNELEITDLNKMYLHQGLLNVKKLSNWDIWMDAGTIDSLLDASNLIAAIEKRQGIKIGCPEEIAYNYGWISEKDLLVLADKHLNSYGAYLKLISQASPLNGSK
jgi:glucose-1-phosphate thymidylyltransferase